MTPQELVIENLNLMKEVDSLKNQLSMTASIKDVDFISKNIIDLVSVSDYIESLIDRNSKVNIYTRILSNMKNLINCDNIQFWATRHTELTRLTNQSVFDSSKELLEYLSPLDNILTDNNETLLFINDYVLNLIINSKPNEVKLLSNSLIKLKDFSQHIYLCPVNGQVGELYGIMFVHFKSSVSMFSKIELILSLLNKINSFVLFSDKYILYFYNINKDLKDLVNLDGLTGIGNRRSLDNYGNELECSGIEFTIISFDIDKFKEVNDTYGHDSGDIVIKTLASVFNSYCNRINAKAFRFGGDEFIGICISTPLKHIVDEMENFRRDIQNKDFIFENSKVANVTVSIGIASDYNNYEACRKDADIELYKVKKTMGRNNISCKKEGN